jgi:prepilin-type N-terminal cleavage/methylation domain-containing protein
MNMMKIFKNFYFLNKRNSSRIKALFKQESGLTLIEVIIALLVISIVTVVLVRGTMLSVDVVQIDKAKTQSLAVANEKMELLKNMEYEDVELVKEGDSEYDIWLNEHPELEEDGYDIDYEITWVGGEENSYKQVKLTICKEPMNTPVNIITQIYSLEEQEGSGEDEHPAPINLFVEYDDGYGSEREVKLVWEPPDTEMEINKYNIYMDGSEEWSAYTELYVCYPGDNESHNFYVTAVYTDLIESDPSNTVYIEIKTEYPPPQNLRITGYTGTGSNRKVNLAWDVPDAELTVVEYIIYRNGVEIDRTSDTSFSNKIGKTNYTFYITALYEGDNESEQSNSVTTG